MLPAEKRIFKAVCPDKRCQAVLYVYTYEKTIECHHCGQHHSKDSLQDLREVSSGDLSEAVQSYLCRMLINKSTPKRGIEMTKILGLSNYYCKLLSPLLTRYGMDKNTGRAKLLSEMNQGEIFDCSLFGDRAFLIEPEHIPIHGFGKDITGSLGYLSETLKLIIASNGCEERLIPIHSDGDGHCLVHAVSRALVGRELFWHPLRCCLKKHFEANLDKYKELFKDFIDTVEWPAIIEECDPNFQPPEGELHGLRNIHIFGLANVLRRPIILLDSLECMQKCGDYSALFLPGFVRPEACRGKDNALNKPLCIAWSSYSHNHYIPLVGVQKKPLPVLPSVLIPKAWGMPQSEVMSYIEFDSSGNCVIGGNRILSNAYIQRLVLSMEMLYYETNGIHPSLVADAKLYLYPDNILFSAKPSIVLERTKAAVQEGCLYRCLICRALCELRQEDNWIPSNSAFCSQYPQNFKRIHQDSQSINFQGLLFKYDSARDRYVIDTLMCTFCRSQSVRKVTSDGTVIFRAEDKDNLDRNMRLYDQGKKYITEDSFSQKSLKDTKPSKIPLKLEWNGKEVDVEISCFDFFYNGKERLNEFVKELSKKLIEKHFSDKSEDSELQAYVSEEIWKLVRKYELRNNSESPSRSEAKRQESAKSMKMENTSQNTCDGETQNTLECGKLSKPSHSQFQYVKVVTSNGQQANLALTEDGISYGQLQEWVKNQFNIPVRNQLIKKGFPPEPIEVSGDTNKQMLTDLKNRDRLIVSIVKEDSLPISSSFASPRPVLKESNIPKSLVKCPSDISWESIKSSPANFRRNGFMFKKIAEKNKITSSLHTSLEEYPNKVFCYNRLSDSIELCVKPLGHFLISSDIDERIDEVRRGLYVLGFSQCPLYNNSDEMIDSLSVLHTVASANKQKEEFRSFASPRPVLKESNIPESLVKCPSDISWESIKSSPANFRRNGFMFKKIAEKNEITSSLHTSLEEYPNKVFCYNRLSDSIELCVKPLGHFLISSDIDERIDEVRRGLYVLGFSQCPLYNNSDEMIDSLSVLHTVASANKQKEESQRRPLLRKGPGFSVLSNPDDMDIS